MPRTTIIVRSALFRRLSQYGLVVAWALLCLLFSVATYRDQSPTGPAAARQLAAAIGDQFGQKARVLIVARDEPADVAFARALAAELAAGGIQPSDTVIGEPSDARQALMRIAKSGESLDAVACTQPVSAWLVLADLPTDFPTLATNQDRHTAALSLADVPLGQQHPQHRQPNCSDRDFGDRHDDGHHHWRHRPVGRQPDRAVAVLTAGFIRDYAGATEAGRWA